MTQIPLKTHIYPTLTKHTISFPPTLSNLKLLKAFESFLTNLLMYVFGAYDSTYPFYNLAGLIVLFTMTHT